MRQEGATMFTTRHRIAVALTAVLAVAVTLVGPTTPAQASLRRDLHARLHSTSAFPHAHGGADYRSGHHGRELDLGLAGVRKLNGKTVRVYVHGDFVAGMRVRFGSAHLHRHSGVPVVRRGSTVSVRTTGGTLVAAGTFRRGCCHHHM
jgi:hypothetical protein